MAEVECPYDDPLKYILMNIIKAHYRDKKTIETIVRSACNGFPNNCSPLHTWNNEYNLMTKEDFANLRLKYANKHDSEYCKFNSDTILKLAKPYDTNNELQCPSDSEDKNIHDAIWTKFIKWGESNNLVRLRDTPITLKRVNEYHAETQYKNYNETLNAFIYTHQDLFAGKGLKSKRDNLLTFLQSNQPNDRFPVVETNWRYFGYSNGLLDIKSNTFITEEYPDVLCRNYFDVPYEPLTDCPYVLYKVYKDQDWADDTIELYLGMLGRSYTPINEMDKYGVFPFNYGVTSTGKSLSIETVQLSLKPEAVGCVTSGESRFSLHCKNSKELLVIGEAEMIHKGISEDNFKRMARGEIVETEGKGKDSVTELWNTQVLFSGNTQLNYRDNGGGVSSRIVPFAHTKKVSIDTSLRSQLNQLIPSIVPLLITKYHLLIQRNPTRLDLPEQVLEWRDETKMENNYFQAWLSSMKSDVYEMVEYCEGHSITPIELEKSWNKHWKYSLNKCTEAPKITASDKAELMAMGVEIKKMNCCRFCEKPHKKDCCEKYTREGRKKLMRYYNASIVSGGLQTKFIRYDTDDEVS